MKPKHLADVDRLFRAFADSTRLRLLFLLRDRELCVCDLVTAVGAPQPTVSRNLSLLKKAGLVQARKEGLWMYYRLAKPANSFHAKLVDCLTCCFEEVPEFRKDAARLATSAQKKGCC